MQKKVNTTLKNVMITKLFFKRKSNDKNIVKINSDIY